MNFDLVACNLLHSQGKSAVFLSPNVSQRGLLKWVCPSVRPSEIPSIHKHSEMGSLWMQVLLQFWTDFFETLQVFL